MSTIDDLVVGDIILVPGHNIVSRIIKSVTHSKYSHAACYIGNNQIIESAKGGVQISSINKYPGWIAIRHKYATPKQLKQAVAWMKSKEGAGYDYFGLLGIGMSMLFSAKGNVWDNKKRYWCSELVADGYLMANINIDVSAKTWKVSPQQFYAMTDLFEEVKNGK